MRARGVILCVLALVLLSSAAGAQEKNLLALAGDLGAVLEWDPLRDMGVLSFGDDRIALGVGTGLALINYRRAVVIDPPARRDGAVWLTTGAVAAISDAVQNDRLAHAGERLRVAYLLLDPGHGGVEPGSIGSYLEGTKRVTLREKDVTLKIAQKLSGLLGKEYPDKEVVFTRADDRFVSLENRTVIANTFLEKTSDAVHYVSIHANSTLNKSSKASGFEVWVLPPTYQRKLLDEKTVGRENLDILPILNSMFEEEISVESVMLAQEILRGLDGSVGKVTGNRGLRQNDWYVVRNARMPAVLVEVGFVSSEEEAARLADDTYLNDVAAGIYTGIRAFVARFERNGSGGAR